MTELEFDAAVSEQVERVLGYLNFSSGAEDAAFLKSLNELFQFVSQNGHESQPPYDLVHQLLSRQLEESCQNNSTFKDADQARRAIELVFDHILPGYMEHHRDLLFHRGPESIFNAFFVGRTFETVLQLAAGWSDTDASVQQAIGQLNDFIGHRPVAVLESQKLQPYEHEWVRPIPCFIQHVGVVHGHQQEIIQRAIELLNQTDDSILELAQFDPKLLDELAIDPRSFDFDHPVNKRPNHHFGQWDEHHIDGQGNYRRFVIHQVTLDALASRVESEPELPREELVFEAGAVLAGTVLMAAGICGRGPGAHDSTVTLTTLLPKIAHYRDEFYTHLLNLLSPPHQNRLIEEAQRRKQPFGAARQHLNRQLACYRAFQMVHVNLALIFARMGYDQAANRHANVLPVASARMICQIDCLLFAGQQALEDGDTVAAAETIPRLFDLLIRAVNCGAVIDPWNIIGFDANYNLFQGTENTVRDHRADELVLLMDQLFGFCSQVWIASEAADHRELSQRVQEYFIQIVDWWRKYAAHEVASVDSVDAKEIFDATENVAKALNLWHKSGAERGDVQFWAQHARLFNSPRAYILAIQCLVERHDFVTSMALLIHWLSQSDQLPLRQGAVSFQDLFSIWIGRQRSMLDERATQDEAVEIWKRVCKFCDFMEANAGDHWQAPTFELENRHPRHTPADDMIDDGSLPADDDNPYRAAYEDMVYRETTDDGFDGSVFDESDHSDDELQLEMERVTDRLEFIEALANYWLESALIVNRLMWRFEIHDTAPNLAGPMRDKIEEWAGQAQQNCQQLEHLVESIQAYPLPQADGGPESLMRYDRHRLFKETLLDTAINVNVESTRALRHLSALLSNIQQHAARTDVDAKAAEATADRSETPDENSLWTEMLAAVLTRDTLTIQSRFDEFISCLGEQPLLYVPLSKGGDALKIVATRLRQCSIAYLLECLPRLGLLTETRELIHTALMMERNQTVRQGAVTEFDELFRTGYTAIVQALIDAAGQMQDQLSDADTPKNQARRQAETALFDCLEMLTESMLLIWLSHSQTLRLSVLEKVKDGASWKKLTNFIEQFGDQMFTQQFLNLSNIRAILHQGVDHWLAQLEQQPDLSELKIVAELQRGYPRKDAVKHITVVLESIIENFNEYRDYNSTTTQSDNGQLLHILLDFLRLRSKYEQVCWNLKPVVWAHEALVRRGQNNVARLWRRLLTERVNPEADKFEASLKKLQDKYSIQMATIAQRVSERFVHPMQVDRLVSLVEPAMKDPRSKASQRAFELIEHYAEALIQQPLGIGFELPGWITALNDEVDCILASRSVLTLQGDDLLIAGSLPSLDHLRAQLEQMPRRQA